MSLSQNATTRNAAGPVGVRPYVPVPIDLLRDNRLTSTDKVLAAAIAAYAIGGKPTAWPSVARLARDIGKSPRTVRYGLRRLAAAGWIESRPDDGNATGRVLCLLWRVAAPPATERPARVAGEVLKRHEGRKPAAGDVPDGTGSPPPARPGPEPDRPAEPEPLVTDDVISWLSEGPGHPLRRAAERRFASAGLPLPDGIRSTDVVPPEGIRSTDTLPTPTAPRAFDGPPLPFAVGRGGPGRAIGRPGLGDALAAVLARPRRPRL